MKLIYISEACSEKLLDSYTAQYNLNNIFAQQKWDYDLAKGLFHNLGENLFCLSDPPVSSYPNCRCVSYKKCFYNEDGFGIYFPHIINLPLVKQLHLLLKTYHFIRKICRKYCREQVIILTGGVIPQFSLAAFAARKRFGCKVFSVMPDLPGLVVVNQKHLSWLINASVNMAKSLSYKFDGYVCFSAEQMKHLNQEKPHIVIEGLIDSDYISSIEPKKLSTGKKVVIYAGQLMPEYGVELLMEAFLDERLEEYELWLFGKGSCVKKLEELNATNIKYKGLLSRSELISYEKSAYLLINARSVNMEFSKCSFPSKLIEYMTTGTPVLTTRLKSIGEEYNNMMYYIDEETKECIIEKILSLECENIAITGERAKCFVEEKKSANRRAKQLISFLTEPKGDNKKCQQ